jgi:hypothetical protein
VEELDSPAKAIFQGFFSHQQHCIFGVFRSNSFLFIGRKQAASRCQSGSIGILIFRKVDCALGLPPEGESQQGLT